MIRARPKCLDSLGIAFVFEFFLRILKQSIAGITTY